MLRGSRDCVKLDGVKISRVVAPLFLALTLLLQSPIGAATAGDPGPGSKPGAKLSDANSIDVGSYNIRANRSLKKFRRAVRAFRDHVEVAGLQEVNTKEKTAWMQGMPGWRSYRPRRLLQNPVIWRHDKFKRVSARAAKIAKGRYVGHENPGSDAHRSAQLATVVRLRHRATGQRLSVINVHLTSGAVNGGRCLRGRPRLCDLYKDSVRGLVRPLRREQRWAAGRVILLGDFNDNYPADKRRHRRALAFSTLHRHGLVAHWERRSTIEPGHGSGARAGAYLDQIWARGKPAQISVRRDVRDSDHYPVLAKYAIRPLAGG